MPLKSWLKAKKTKKRRESAAEEEGDDGRKKELGPLSDDTTIGGAEQQADQEMSAAVAVAPSAAAAMAVNGSGDSGSRRPQKPPPEPWRVESLRSGPPREADWWEDCSTKDNNNNEESTSRMDLSLDNNIGGGNDTADEMSLDSQIHYSLNAANDDVASSAVCCGVDLAVPLPTSSLQIEDGAKTKPPPPPAAPPAAAAAVAVSASDQGGGDSSSSTDGGGSSSKRIFRNQGFELWMQSRKEWRNYPDVGKGADDTNGDSCGKSVDSAGSGGRFGAAALEGLSAEQAEDVLRGLTRVTRVYQLPHKVALPDMVDLLNDIWECERDY